LLILEKVKFKLFRELNLDYRFQALTSNLSRDKLTPHAVILKYKSGMKKENGNHLNVIACKTVTEKRKE
jgi:hypothetical protein